MSFLHHPAYAYGGHVAVPMDQPNGPRQAMQNNMDGYLLTRPAYKLTDFYNQVPLMEDYEEYAENLSRPRLTKEQVDTLEAQFQAHPKPNSNKKRELAVQTNLSLPRVANWFQNRRAKAKQQKRQEEFERMQREAKEKSDHAESVDAEESASGAPECDDDDNTEQGDNANSATKSPTPMQASSSTKDRIQDSSNSSSLPGPKHQKTASDLAQEKTYASLQRAISAAVAARDQYSESPDPGLSTASTWNMVPDLRPTNMSMPGTSNAPHISANSSFSEWSDSRDSSIVWTPSQSPEEGWEFGSLNNVSFASEVGHLEVSQSSHIPGSQELSTRHQQFWNSQQIPSRPEIHASDPIYGSLSFSAMQPHSASSSRRPSSTEDTIETINGIGLHTTPLNGNVTTSTWRRPEKELDLAARRKRPRPAAIGTAHHRLVTNPSVVSPNARMAGLGPPHGLRHAKSSQALSSRYAGIRKVSATQRSPLGYSSFAEAASATNIGVEPRQKHRLHTSASVGNLAPPTPMTPEDLQPMLPTTHTTSTTPLQFSSQPLTETHGLFMPTQPMQMNVTSPPETPLTLDVITALQYQNLGASLSTPPLYASFTDCSPLTSEPLTAVSWAVSTPDTSLFPPSLQSQHQPPIYIYEQDDNEQQDSKWAMVGEDESPLYGSTKSSATPPASMMTVSEDQDPNAMTQFHIHEFPKQQEAHRDIAQQLAPQIPRSYTFSNQTPSDF